MDVEKKTKFWVKQIIEDGLSENLCYGFELNLDSHKAYIESKYDIILVWLHWCMLRNRFAKFNGRQSSKMHRCLNCWSTRHALTGHSVIHYYVYKKVPIGVKIQWHPTTGSATISSLTELCVHTFISGSYINKILNSILQMEEDMLRHLIQSFDNAFIRPLAKYIDANI